MSLGLVDYGSSDESDKEGSTGSDAPISDIKTEPTNVLNITINKNKNDVGATSSTKDSVDQQINVVKSNVEDITVTDGVSTILNDEDEVSMELSKNYKTSVNADRLGPVKTKTLSSLPKPKTTRLHDIDFDWRQLSSKHSTQPIKISVPSLSELDAEDDSEPLKKRLKPSKTGSGLFALLPSPKNGFIKQSKTNLMPPQLKSKPTPPLSRSSTAINKSAVKNEILHQKSKQQVSIDYNSPDEDDDNEDSGKVDFFSLSSSVTVPDSEIQIPDDLMQIEKTLSGKQPNDKVKTVSPVKQEKLIEGSVSTTNVPTFSSSSTDINYSNVGASNSYISFTQSEQDDLQLDQTALQQLCGRRERNQRGSEVELIDINGDAILPDAREWMTKQLTEEQGMSSHSHNRKDGPTTQQRRKHQITYLAFQAKEHELELKNQWANSRMSRKQTQAKYGF